MKILFVCTANICRSALAEVLLKEALQQKGLTDIDVASAGVRDLEGEPRDYTMALFARKAGYQLAGEAKYITQALADSADLIICMAQYHVVELQRRFVPYARWNCIRRFNEICFGEPTDMPDPTGGSEDMYRYAYKRIEEGCGILARKLLEMQPDGELSIEDL